MPGLFSMVGMFIAPPRLMSSPLSLVWADSAGFAGFIALSGHTSPPRLPSDELKMATCMSWTGKNSAVLPLGQVPSDAAVLPVGFLLGSRQLGAARRAIMFGTASASSVCLSPIDGELSIMNSRSTLSMVWLCTLVVNVVFSAGARLMTSRSRQPAATMPRTPRAVVMAAACLTLRFMIVSEAKEREGACDVT